MEWLFGGRSCSRVGEMLSRSKVVGEGEREGVEKI
jgi:hypothetical protein